MASSNDSLTLETLIEYEPFVRKVLRNMVVGEDQLNDLVQETWVRVLKRPPKRGKGVRGWLATVARNLARDAKRGNSHRAEREAFVARAEADTSAQASNERLELHQQVVQAVLQLEEPYKTVVVLCYYEGLSPAQIAVKLGRNEATVRSQLHRAHGQLKGRLDREFGERRTWLAIGVPWILSKEGPHALTAPAATEGSLATATWIALAATTVIALAVWGPRILSEQEPDSSLASTHETSQSFASNSTIEDLWRPIDSQAVLRESGSPATEAALPETHLDVLATAEGIPIPGAEVWSFLPLLRSPGGFISNGEYFDLGRMMNSPARLVEISRERSQIHRTDENGRAQIPVKAGHTLLFVQAPGRFGIQILKDAHQVAAEESPHRFEVPQDWGARVQVTDRAGRPLADVPVELLSAEPDGSWRPVHIKNTALGSGEVQFNGYRPSVNRTRFAVRTHIVGGKNAQVELEPDGSETPVILAVEPFGSIQWRYHGRAAEQDAFAAEAWFQALDENGQPLGPPAWLPSNGPSGTWPCVALGLDLHVRLESVSNGMQLEWSGAGPQVAGEQVLVELREGPTCQVRGRMMDETKQSVAYRFAYSFQLLNEQREVVQELRILPNVDGHFRIAIPTLPEDPGPLQAEIVGFWATSEGNQRVHIVLPEKAWTSPGSIDLGIVASRMVPHSILGRLVDEDGNALPDVQVEALQDRSPAQVLAQSSFGGEFALKGIWNAPVEVRVSPGQGWYLAQPFVWNGSFDRTELVLQPTGSIVGKVSADPQHLARTLYCLGEGERADFQVEVQASPAGEFRVDGLPPGIYRLSADPSAAEPTESIRIQVFGGQASEAGLLEAR